MNYKRLVFGTLLVVVGVFGACFVLFGNDGLPLWDNLFLAILFEAIVTGVGAPLIND
jgi:hypothetical protein